MLTTLVHVPLVARPGMGVPEPATAAAAERNACCRPVTPELWMSLWVCVGVIGGEEMSMTVCFSFSVAVSAYLDMKVQWNLP